MLQNFSVYFQRFPVAPGGSTRHNCNMERENKPYSAAGERRSAARRTGTKSGQDELLAATKYRLKALGDRIPVGREVADRLLTDPRMDAVWRGLLRKKKYAPDRDNIENLPEGLRLGHWGLAEYRLSHPQRACVALFADTVKEFSLDRPAGTIDDADERAAPYFAAAEVCRKVLDQPPYPPSEMKQALEMAAAYIEELTTWQLKHLKDSPYTMGKRSNERSDGAYRSFSDIERGRVRHLLNATITIYGRPLPAIVAEIASVALNKEVPLKSVLYWRRTPNKQPS
jgi:hypothetical protein